MAKMVDFFLPDDIVQAYENQATPCFAIWHDKQLKYKFQGEDTDAGSQALSQLLDMLNKPGNYAVYTLCVYEGLNPGEKIKSVTPYDASFNFQLNKNENAVLGRVGAVSGNGYTQAQMDLAVKCALLEKENEELKNMAMEQTEAGVMGAVGEIIKIPGVGELIGAISAKISEAIAGIGKKPVQYEQEPMRRISGIDVDMDVEKSSLYTDVDKLLEVLPDLPQLVKKLVRMSEKNRVMLNIFVTGLRNMKI